MSDEVMQNQESDVAAWFEKIENAERHYAEYHRLIEEIRRYYRNDFKGEKQNIFWSSVETLKPFLYFKQPKPYIECKEKGADKVGTLACRMMENALQWDLEQFDFDSVMKYARNDFLLSGMGVVIERYCPKFGRVDDLNGKSREIKIDEAVVTEYVDPRYFIADADKVGIWEDCQWFGIRHYLTAEEAIETFGEAVKADLCRTEQSRKSVEVYEIWDKVGQRVLYVSKISPKRFLRVIDKAGATVFYHLPKPLFATSTNDNLIPVPDYVQIKPLLDELDGVTARMEKTMKAIKVSGCYDNAFPELGSILNKDVALVALSDFDRLKAAGGIQSVVDFMPIAQYITALQTLAQRRQEIVNAIYEITGVSDIMRGASNVGDTATAVTKKTNFGTLRNQDRQNDMQRFMADLFRIKADIICEQFDKQKLLEFLPKEERQTTEAQAAVELLKTEHLRRMVFGVESDVTFGEGDKASKNLEAITAIHTMISQAFNVVSQQPALLNLYRQMIAGMTACLSNARQYENVLSSCFDKIALDLAAPKQATKPAQNDNMSNAVVQLQQQKNLWDYEIKKEQNDLKRAEIGLKFEELKRKE